MRFFWMIVMLVAVCTLSAIEEDIPFLPKEIIATDTTQVDTLKYDITELRENLEKFLEQQQSEKKFVHEMSVKENFHFQSPFQPSYHFRKNGFTILPFQIGTAQILQNHYFAYQAHRNGNIIDFSKKIYELPIAFTNSYLALGADDHNYVGVDFNKGDVMGIDGLTMNLNFLGQSGEWLGINEKSRNFDLQLSYPVPGGNIHFFNTTIDQRISTDKLLFPPQNPLEDNLREYTSDSAILWENSIFDLGYRFERTHLDSLEREMQEILLAKEIESENHSLRTSFEYFWEDEISYFNLDHFSKFGILQMNNSGFYSDENEYLFRPELSLKITDGLAFNSGYNRWKSQLFPQDFIFEEITFRNSFLNLELEFGLDEEHYFIELRNHFNHRISNWKIELSNFLLMDEDGVKTDRYQNQKTLPKYQTQNAVNIICNLAHNNAVEFGLTHTYHTSHRFTQDTTAGDLNANSTYLQAHLKLQITDQFKIGVNVENLTSSDFLFSFPDAEITPEAHVNANVEWIFIN